MKLRHVRLCGYDLDIEQATENLVINELYELDYVNVGTSSTQVYIVGFDKSFNSVLFEPDQKDKKEYESICTQSFKQNYNLGD